MSQETYIGFGSTHEWGGGCSRRASNVGRLAVSTFILRWNRSGKLVKINFPLSSFS